MSLGQLISIASMLIVIKLTTTCMDMNDYGRYGLLITLGSMSSLITHIGINSGIPRIYSLSCSESKNNEGLKASGKVLLDSFKLLLGLLLVLVMLTGFGISIDTHYYFVIVFSWITTTNLIINDVHNIVRKRALVVASLLFDAIFKSSILYVVFHYYSASVDAVFMALASSAFLTISFNVFLLYRFHDLKFKSLISDKHVQHYRKKYIDIPGH